jgi:DNA-binding CsgD family transcriptional regulator
VRRGRPPHPELLTPREQEVLAYLRDDLTNAEIAVRLGISPDGVKYHVSEILSKLGVSSRQEAAAWRPGRRQFFGLLFMDAILRRLPFGASTAATKAAFLAGGGAAIVIVAIGAYALTQRGEGGTAESRTAGTGQNSSPFLTLLEQLPVTQGEVWMQFSDFARARQLLNLDPPNQDAGRFELQDYAGALGGSARIPLSLLLQGWGLASRATDWNNELGFNIANIDQSLELWMEIPSNPPPEVALLGRFDVDRVVKAMKSTSSFSEEVREESYAGMTFSSWRDDFLPGRPQTAGARGGPWPPRLGGRALIEDEMVVWTYWTDRMTAIIETSTDTKPSLGSGPAYQQLADAFDDLGVYSAFVFPNHDQAWFEARWSLARGEYSRGGMLVEPAVLLQPYQGFAVGIGHNGSEAYAVLVLLHDDESVAATNASLLQMKLDSDTRMGDGRPWTDIITRSEITTDRGAVRAKFWSSNIALTFDAWRNLESLFWSQS